MHPATDLEERKTWALLKALMKRGPAMTKAERGRYLLDLVRKISKPPSPEGKRLGNLNPSTTKGRNLK